MNNSLIFLVLINCTLSVNLHMPTDLSVISRGNSHQAVVLSEEFTHKNHKGTVFRPQAAIFYESKRDCESLSSDIDNAPPRKRIRHSTPTDFFKTLSTFILRVGFEEYLIHSEKPSEELNTFLEREIILLNCEKQFKKKKDITILANCFSDIFSPVKKLPLMDDFEWFKEHVTLACKEDESLCELIDREFSLEVVMNVYENRRQFTNAECFKSNENILNSDSLELFQKYLFTCLSKNIFFSEKSFDIELKNSGLSWNDFYNRFLQINTLKLLVERYRREAIAEDRLIEAFYNTLRIYYKNREIEIFYRFIASWAKNKNENHKILIDQFKEIIAPLFKSDRWMKMDISLNLSYENYKSFLNEKQLL